MRTPQQALQDAIDSGAVAAFIAGNSIEVRYCDEVAWKNSKDDNPRFVDPHYFWRPTHSTFPDPPEGEAWHNPDNLTPEQIGEGYRLLLVSEIKDRPESNLVAVWRGYYWGNKYMGCVRHYTYCVPLSTPFHWDAPKEPKRIPLPPEAFIGAWIKVGKTGCYYAITRIDGNEIYTINGYDTIKNMIHQDTLVRLANTTEFVPCYTSK